jgi:hypothetical protein
MNPDQENVRHIQLSDGKLIEVFFLDYPRDEEPAAGAEAGRTQPQPRELHRCQDCGSDFVQPLEWEPAGPAGWEVLLRCPECEHLEIGVFSQREVDHFDAELDDGSEALEQALREFTRRNMSEDIERFVDALQRELVLPCDF